MWTSHPSTTHNNMEDVWRDISSGTGIIEPVSSGRIILQDFFSKDPPLPPVHSTTTPTTPRVMLSLRGPNFVQETDNSTNHHSNNKRYMTSDQNEIDCDANRRHKRMIKNRESAARSRARKQEINLSFSLLFKSFNRVVDN